MANSVSNPASSKFRSVDSGFLVEVAAQRSTPASAAGTALRRAGDVAGAGHVRQEPAGRRIKGRALGRPLTFAASQAPGADKAARLYPSDGRGA